MSDYFVPGHKFTHTFCKINLIMGMPTLLTGAVITSHPVFLPTFLQGLALTLLAALAILAARRYRHRHT